MNYLINFIQSLCTLQILFLTCISLHGRMRYKILACSVQKYGSRYIKTAPDTGQLLALLLLLQPQIFSLSCGVSWEHFLVQVFHEPTGQTTFNCCCSEQLLIIMTRLLFTKGTVRSLMPTNKCCPSGHPGFHTSERWHYLHDASPCLRCTNTSAYRRVGNGSQTRPAEGECTISAPSSQTL